MKAFAAVVPLALMLTAGAAMNGRDYAVDIKSTAPKSAAPRLISLAPSLTEIAFAIGCGRELVADTLYDNYPPSAKRMPHVADLVNVDIERVAQLHPTAIIALHDQEREGSRITSRLGIRVSYLPNRGMADLFADIDGVGIACRQRTRAATLQRQLALQIRQLTYYGQHQRSHPRVLYLLGLPGFVAGKGSYINDLLRDAGAINAAGTVDQPYPNVSEEQILTLNPDVLIVSNSVPFGPDVRARPPWSELQAVRAGRIKRPPSDDLIERNGPRVVDGLRWLVRAVHANY